MVVPRPRKGALGDHSLPLGGGGSLLNLGQASACVASVKAREAR